MPETPVRLLVAAPTPPGTLEALAAVSPRVEVVVPTSLLPLADPGFDAALTSAFEEAAGIDAVFTQRLPKTWQPDGRLAWAQMASAGVDYERGKPIWNDPAIAITNAAGIHGPAMSEWAAAMLLMYSRNVLPATAWKSTGEWPAQRGRLGGGLLMGKTLGIVGYGAVGTEVARLGRAFGMRVIALNRTGSLSSRDGKYVPARLAERLAMAQDEVELHASDHLHAMLAESDYVVISAGLNEASHHLIGATELALMKPEAVIVNVARGGLIDEAALVDALRSGRLRGAALDVFDPEPPSPDNPLFGLGSTILSPHVSGAFSTYYDWAHELFRENVARFIDGRPLLNLVDRSVDA